MRNGELTLNQIKTWKTVRIGYPLIKTADDFRNAFKRDGCRLSDWGNDILSKPEFTPTATETDVELVNVSVADLDFKVGATRCDIYKRALNLGLELCPHEVGPQLRLQYKDQPKGERLLIAMEPIADSGDRLSIFSVEQVDVGLWLYANYGSPDGFWHSYHRFVFARPK